MPYAILMDLQTRAKDADGARAVVDSLVFHFIGELVGSVDAEVCRRTCGMLREMARHGTTARAVVGQLVSLLRGGNPKVIESAAETLCSITTSPEGAQAAVDMDVLNCVAELLSSPNDSVRRWTCSMLGWLAYHKSTVPAVLSANPCQPLVSLLHGGNPTVIESVAKTLYWIAVSPEGAQAAVDANVLECMAELLSSPNASVRQWTRYMLGELACHITTTSLAMEQLVSLLQGGNPTVIKNVAQVLYQVYKFPDTAQAAVNAKVLACMVQPLVSLLRDEAAAENAIYVLYQISRVPDGAQAVFNAKLLGTIAECLQSPSPRVQERACQVIGNLATHASIASAIIEVNLAERLVYLLHKGYTPNEVVKKDWEFLDTRLRRRHEDVISQAMYALSRIARWVDTADAIVEAKALDHLLALFQEVHESNRGGTRRWACDLIRNLAQHESTVSALLTIDPCRQLVALLHDCGTDPATRTSAGRALARISQRPEGAAAMVDSGVVQALLEMNENE
ncbi:armadillo-type protein [Mycena capillaripes]|nr:armadillo-type protein [Mycena capillaripes]